MKTLSFSFPTEVVVEGMSDVVVPMLEAFVTKPSDYAPSKAPVFYNPVMEMNRDLAVLALQTLQRTADRELLVCEPLAGCGVRGIRLAKEVEGVASVFMNDINNEAYHLAKFNVERNGVADRIVVDNEDANISLSRFGAPRKRFDYIDVDPFGSPTPYLDSALRALRRGGCVALTATDVAPLCGIHPKACIRKYGGRPLRTEYCHELAVRLLAGALARTAAKHDIGVKMLFSNSSRHYVRLYATVDYGARKADASLSSMGYIHHCFSCFYRKVSMGLFSFGKFICPECNTEMKIAGPLWIGKIVDKVFADSMDNEAKSKQLREKRRIHRLLASISGEAEAPITYYNVDAICDKIGLPVPPMKRVVTELETAGYKVSLTHFAHQGIKTDASACIVKQAVAGTC